LSEIYVLKDKNLTRAAQPSGFEAPPIHPQTNLLAQPEQRLLNWLCKQMPSATTPDLLTGIGFVGAVIVFAGYLGSSIHPAFLWLASLGLIVHWFGDSLDGSLARYRRIERLRYGYFLDHSVDAISISLILIGFGFCPYIHFELALFAVFGNLLMCTHEFLFDHVTGNFKKSFFVLGPTELRIILVVVNFLMYFKCSSSFTIGHQSFTVYDVALCGGCIFLVYYYIRSVTAAVRWLRREDPLPRGSARVRNLRLL
jgi:phosphatidylglycerophosphate synthase